MIILILAGGLGSRLFPLSTKDFPKPFIPFISKDSLLKQTIKRFIYRNSVTKILICANTDHENLIQKEIKDVDHNSKCQMILEPGRKNTLSAITFGLCHLQKSDYDQPVFVVPIDHFIHPEKEFIFSIEKIALAMPINKLVCLGVIPVSPEIEYGYIEVESGWEDLFYLVRSFIEKPSQQKADQYLLSKNYLWNMGILGFYPETFFKQLSIHLPEYEKMRNIDSETMFKFYRQIESISVDQGLLQKSNDLVCVKLDITWADIGNLDRFYASRKIFEEQRAEEPVKDHCWNQ